jgi:hypothetical protein
MAEHGLPADIQEAMEREFRVQWGGKRFCAATAIVLLALALIAAAVTVFARRFDITGIALKITELSALVTSFVCLVTGVVFGLDALIRAQRERGQLPDRTIHFALSLSVITVAVLGFFGFLTLASWSGSEIGRPASSMIQTIRFIVFLFSGLVWLASVVMNSAGVAILLTRRNDLLEFSNTQEGTTLLFRRGYSSEITKLAIGSLISLIIFVVALLVVGSVLLGA